MDTEYNLATYLTQRCHENGMNLLMMACFNNRLNIIQYLLKEHHVNIHDTDDYGNNALMYAMCNQNIDIVYYLLDSKELKEHANLYQMNQRGETVFTYACEDRNMGLIEYFLFEHNMIVEDITIQWLKQNEYYFILDMISTRDLYQKLGVDLFEKITHGLRGKYNEYSIIKSL